MAKAKKKKFYTVWVGRTPGVYFTWDECKMQTDGFENSVYKSFSSLEEAERAFDGDSRDFIGNNKKEEQSLSEEEIRKFGFPILDSICVDGAWNTSTNAIEYQGVYCQTKERIFHVGPYSAGTNNIAEFLAIVHALAHCKKNCLTIPIYSDSRTAMSWVRKKKASTKIQIDSSTMQIVSIVKRAEDWLMTNSYDNHILKWETKAWGENPADFGRK